MRALITGSSGFIGSHLSDDLEAEGYEVVRCDLDANLSTVAMDIMNMENVQQVLEKYRPNYLINLAGQANVGLSWKKPQLTMQVNTIGLINILEAIRFAHLNTRVIAVGSADEYGDLRKLGEDVTESIPVKPMTPYAISKHAQELFAKLYLHTYGMDICMIRMFNLGGPGQTKGYMISDFASGIAEMEKGKKDILSVGNLESARDYTHVKDACRAIRLILEKGQTGEIYNICSGKAYQAKVILEKLICLARVPVHVKQDPAKMRPSDTPVLCGNHGKVTAHTGWKPEYSLDDILLDSLNYWRMQN